MSTPVYPFYPFDYSGLVTADAVCAVIRGESAMFGSGLCGYCLFEKHEVPVEWHGDYNSDGLGLLNVHGGITYCEVEGGDIAARDRALKALRNDSVFNSRPWHERHEIWKRERAAHGYTHVVFGFDCAHYGDRENTDLYDPQHVFGLARVMHQQIVEHARRIGEYRAATEERRLAILDEIRATAESNSEVPVFGIMSMLSKVQP